MERINLAELLKDCPKGMELDCTMYEDVYFDYVDELNIIHCYIQHETHKTSITFNQHGTPNSDIKSKCVIFPKGKTTWEGFHRPYVNGDIVYTIGGSIAIISDKIGEHSEGFNSYCRLFNYEFDFDIIVSPERLATEKEKEKLFDAIKANGYTWNAKTKTLEKLIEPKFKVGDKIRHKSHTREGNIVTEIKDTHYILDDELALPFTFQDEYELVPNKFNTNTLVPFESRVLVRNDKDQYWIPAFWGGKRTDGYTTSFGWSKYCIPFDGNEHLLNSNKECDEFYRTWEKTGD